MEPEIDKAFDWLVLILAVIAAAMCQFALRHDHASATRGCATIPGTRSLAYDI